MKVLKGFIADYCEMGSEGITDWVFSEDSSEDKYRPMHNIDSGDHLKIFGENGEVLFDGVIEHSRRAGRIRQKDGKYSLLPFSLGYMVTWIQKGWNADEWGKLFFHARLLEGSNGEYLRAELIKKVS